MSGANVLSLFNEPRKADCLRAVSLAMLKVRASGLTCEQIAGDLCCSAETVENASNERSMLGFEQIARLAAKYPEVAPLIEGLWNAAPIAAPTIEQRIERIESEIDAIRREVA